MTDPLFVDLGQQVAGQLLQDELIVRFVIVQRFDDIFTVSPCVAMRDVFIKTIGIGIARHIQPVTSPTFSVVT